MTKPKPDRPGPAPQDFGHPETTENHMSTLIAVLVVVLLVALILAVLGRL